MNACMGRATMLPEEGRNGVIISLAKVMDSYQSNGVQGAWMRLLVVVSVGNSSNSLMEMGVDGVPNGRMISGQRRQSRRGGHRLWSQKSDLPQTGCGTMCMLLG